MPTVEWNKIWGKDLSKMLTNQPDLFYGYQWGNPTEQENLKIVVDTYIRPYITQTSCVLEIGPGGGRWTQFLLSAQKLYLVDLNKEFFDHLNNKFPELASKCHFYNTTGNELNDIQDDCVDFVFSFGTFVHIEPEDIASYIQHIYRVLKTGGHALIQYADKKKESAQKNATFSDMQQEKMELIVQGTPLTIIKHDTHLLHHSNIVLLRK